MWERLILVDWIVEGRGGVKRFRFEFLVGYLLWFWERYLIYRDFFYLGVIMGFGKLLRIFDKMFGGSI